MTNFRNTLASLENEAGDIGQLIRKMALKPSPSAIETDLLLEKLRRMYEVAIHLAPGKAEKQITEDHPSPAQIISEETDITRLTNKVMEVEAPSPPNYEISEEGAAKLPASPAQTKPAQTLSEKLSESKTPLYEHITKSSTNKDLASTLHAKPVKTLASSIGVNDKFRYILELFGGQAEGYHKAIAALDSCGSYQEAYDYLTGHLRWDPEKPVVTEITELLKRRWNA